MCALLFAQGALAAYTCPTVEMSTAPGAQSMGLMPCHESADRLIDQAQPALCHAHCQDQQQSADSYQPPVIVTSSQLGAVLTLAITPAQGSGLLPPLPQLRRDTAPPLAIRHCCWRI